MRGLPRTESIVGGAGGLRKECAVEHTSKRGSRTKRKEKNRGRYIYVPPNHAGARSSGM